MRAIRPHVVAAAALLVASTFVSCLTLETSAIAQTARQQEQLLESLRREVSDKLLASGKIAGVMTIAPKAIKAAKLAGGHIQVNFEQALADLSARPKERAAVVQRLVATALSVAGATDLPIAQSKEQFVSSLRLLIRHSDYVRPQTVPVKDHALPSPLSRPFAGDAHIVVAFDRSESLLMATPGTGAAHGLSDEALFDLALAETQKLKTDVTRERFGSLRYLAAREGTFSPSLLLIADLVSELEKELGVDFLVAIPDRTLLLAAPARSASDLMRAMQSSAQQRKAVPHIPHLIQRQGSGWIRFAAR